MKKIFDLHAVKPRKLEQYEPQAFMSELLYDIAERGFENPVLYGGALRDDFMGQAKKIRDYDVSTRLGAVANIRYARG